MPPYGGIRTFPLKMDYRGKNWGKIQEGVIGFSSQTNSILIFRPQTAVQNIKTE